MCEHVCIRTPRHTSTARGQLVSIGFLLQHVAPKDGTQVIKFGGKHPRSQLATLERYSLARRTDAPMWCPTTTVSALCHICGRTEIGGVRPSDVLKILQFLGTWAPSASD